MKKLFTFVIFTLATLSQAQNLTAKSWLVADGDGKILQSENSTEQRSIASISKLMTAIVVLDARQDLDERLKPHTRRELIQLAIVKSDNAAAKKLCEHFPGGMHDCVWTMNRKAQELGMYNTRFIEPTGLSVMNVSTAEELIKLVQASSQYPEIVESSKTRHAKIKMKKHWLSFNNTNPLVDKYNFLVSKTGYIRASGGCIVMMLDTNLGRRIVVLLGSKNTKTRIPEAELVALDFNRHLRHL
jgi:D-alanyl-D-alanine endopeptidase (penicillin-binding protein 7)